MLLKFPFRASRGIEQHLSNLAIESKIVEIKNTQTLTLGRNTNYSTAGSQQLGVICSLEKRTATEPTRGACCLRCCLVPQSSWGLGGGDMSIDKRSRRELTFV